MHNSNLSNEKKCFRGASILFVAAIHLTLLLNPQQGSAQVSVSFGVFYENLSPYGTWVDHPNYGYVWTPRETRGFRPYASQGYWAFTNAGWTWVSNYSWGWAPFHYGRWFRDPYYGWLWAPDYEWGPGWVSWRRSEGYYGWAPIGPGIEIDFAYSSGFNVPNDDWRFVRESDFGRTNVERYYLPTTSYSQIIRNSQPIQNIQSDNQRNVRYSAGPDRADVEKRIGKSIAPLTIRERSKPGQNIKNNQLEIYRPQIQKTAEKKAPVRAIPYKKDKPAEKPQQKQPAKQQPTKQKESQEPKKQQTPKSQPTKETPKQQPTKQKESQEPKKQQPSKSQPTKETPEKQPTKKKPVKPETQEEKKPEKNTPPKKGNG